MTHNYDENLQYWAAIIEEAVNSGMTRAEWCEAHGISIWRYYYWNRKIKDQKKSQGDVDPYSGVPYRSRCAEMQPETDPVFYELPASVTEVRTDLFGSGAGSPMTLEFGHYRLTIPQDVRSDALRTVIQVMRHA